MPPICSDRLADTHDLVVTLEENVLQGGFGQAVASYIYECHPGTKVYQVGLPDTYVEHGNVSILRESLGIDSDSIIKKLEEKGFLDWK